MVILLSLLQDASVCIYYHGMFPENNLWFYISAYYVDKET